MGNWGVSVDDWEYSELVVIRETAEHRRLVAPPNAPHNSSMNSAPVVD